ncbi:N-acetylgalactosamine kinase, partial [Mortierella sp. NVP85]
MAIEDDCLIAVAVDEDHPTIKLANVNPKYPSLEFIPKSRQEGIVAINPEVHVWTNYFLAGFRGLFDELGLDQKPKGMLCLMSGTVPSGAGLSSSSAFVCCTVNATVMAQRSLLPNQQLPSAHELATISIHAEQYAGAMIGGMDQTASILSKPQAALFIEFHPVLK